MSLSDGLKHLQVVRHSAGDRVLVQHPDMAEPARGTIFFVSYPPNKALQIRLDGTEEIISPPWAWVRKENTQ